MEHRVERVSELLIRELSNIIKNEVKDPRISEFVTITDAKVSKDLQNAKIYYSVVGDKKKEETTGKALNDAANFIRVKLKSRLTMRYIPTLKFFLDETFDNAERIYGILKKIEDEKKAAPVEPQDGQNEKKESDK
ncbi:MAG TPA: 30S ribosome-binding factor RbfA [Candidatus Wallbacteria bacterium]|nr:MAG: Ribosome-binding factor A [bacterium ADurb.Bin243]HPG57356.1 30S ribosome-binding factor RbfA [Candidatus Wallbacteria bacterium]